MKYVRAGTLLSFPTAADRDFPSNHVTVTLAPDAPAGIAIDPGTGQILVDADRRAGARELRSARARGR
jgi:hypothetical protein